MTTGNAREPKLQADSDPITVKKYASELTKFEWRKITVRNGTNGPLVLYIHARIVWVWDGESDCAKERW
ncbi:hypothetical protein CCP4SC76_7090004 [Gammaproteobacteria bacterium]